MKNFRRRSPKGSVAFLAFMGVIPLGMAIGAFAIDLMHFNAVQAEVQRACDAGALAGALQLWQYGSNPNAPITAAQNVGGWNDCDGQQIMNITGANVTATVETAPNLTATPPVYGTVRCNISTPYKNIWALMFNNFGGTCRGTALAGANGQVNEVSAGGLFPLAIAIDAIGQVSGKALYQMNVGDTIDLEWGTNVMWTGFPPTSAHNANDVSKLMTAYMNPMAPGGLPSGPVQVNSALDTTNGVQAGNISTISGMVGDVLNMPVIQNGGSQVIGFVSIRVVSVTVNGANSKITGTILPPATTGDYNATAPAIGNTANATWNTWLTNNKPVASARLL